MVFGNVGSESQGYLDCVPPGSRKASLLPCVPILAPPVNVHSHSKHAHTLPVESFNSVVGDLLICSHDKYSMLPVESCLYAKNPDKSMQHWKDTLYCSMEPMAYRGHTQGCSRSHLWAQEQHPQAKQSCPGAAWRLMPQPVYKPHFRVPSQTTAMTADSWACPNFQHLTIACSLLDTIWQI